MKGFKFIYRIILQSILVLQIVLNKEHCVPQRNRKFPFLCDTWKWHRRYETPFKIMAQMGEPKVHKPTKTRLTVLGTGWAMRLLYKRKHFQPR